MIKANIILDSISPSGIRLTTLELIYPRFIHSEFMTHRMFSRNASSSRAIPINKMITKIRNEPAMPIHWGQNQSGMQANTEIENIEQAKQAWIAAANIACSTAELMVEMGLHKQVVNRILEPFSHIHVVCTATEWENFFILRDHIDAQPEIRELAIQMKNAFLNSTPTLREYGQWHLPFIREEEAGLDLEIKRRASTARCARVSYLTHDGKIPVIEKDLDLYDRLVTSKPIHASPTEHQATPMKPEFAPVFPESFKWSGNLRGWTQYRKLIENSFN